MVRTKNLKLLLLLSILSLFLGMSSFAVQTIPGGRITLTNNGIIYGKGIADVFFF